MKGDFSRDSFDAKKHYSGVLLQQGRVLLDADWNEQNAIARRFAEATAKDVVGASGAPQHDAGFALTTDGNALAIGPGRYYVGGLVCENDTPVDYLAQPDFPKAPTIAALMSAVAGANGVIFYLAAFRRVITPIDDPSIQEVALGGADTALRVKTVWQVRALPVKTATGALACGDSAPEWDALVTPGNGLMNARATPAQPTGSPCLLPPNAGYTRLENQLYRVEVHKAGPLASATFKWSRDNGAIVSAVERFNGQQLTLHDLGRDAFLGFGNGQFVELTDDATELAGLTGPILQIDHVDQGTRSVVLKSAPAAIDASLHPKLRRWDGAGETPLAAPAAGDGWVTLEEGVEVQFAAKDAQGNDCAYRAGDYWLIPARTATGSVDWPSGAPQPPRGDRGHYARIGVATFSNGKIQNLQDCRLLFRPLTEVPQALRVTDFSWVNDDDLDQALLISNGLQITFDGPLSSVSPPLTADALATAFSVMVDAPLQLAAPPNAGPAPTVRHLIPLTGDVSFPTPNSILWKPSGSAVELKTLSSYITATSGGSVFRLRTLVRLRGAAFWQDDPAGRKYIDGQVFGDSVAVNASNSRFTLLRPSGATGRASDFESWFFLRLQTPTSIPALVLLDASVINPGGNANGTIVVSFPAGAQGLTVTVTGPAGFTITPVSVPIPPTAVQNPVPFKVTAPPNATAGTVAIVATLNNATAQASLTVQVVQIAVSPSPTFTLNTNETQQFTASVQGSDNKAVTWAVRPGGAGGSISPSGVYAAPGVAGADQVVATSVADPSKSATVAVSIKAPSKNVTKDSRDNKVLRDSKVVRDNQPGPKILGREAKVAELISFGGQAPGAIQAAEAGFEPQDEVAAGRAFILPAQRPEVGPKAGQ